MRRTEIEEEAQGYRDQGLDVIAQLVSRTTQNPGSVMDKPEWHIAARVDGEYEVFRDIRALADAILAGRVGRL